MALETNGTKLANLINPEVMADMISAKVEDKIQVVPYATLDTTLQGQAGDTITLPKWAYIGDAVVVAEGDDIPIRQMTVTSVPHTIQKIGTGVVLTDEAVLSGYGNPIGEANNQMALAITAATDTDALDALYTATTTFTGTGVISYPNIVNAIDLFDEEVQSQKVLFVHPKQVTQLRLDDNFTSADKYDNGVIMNGEIGMIGGARVVASRKVKNDGTNYTNVFVKLNEDTETEDVASALTIFLKRDTNVESDRKSRNRTTEITVDKLYIAALTNEEKVVLMTTAMAAV